jgi:hypothetical protein
MYEYKVVPFIGQAKEGDKAGAQKVAEQLQRLINEVVGLGWEYVAVEQVQIAVKPGCLGALLGVKTAVVNFDQVVFRKPR